MVLLELAIVLFLYVKIIGVLISPKKKGKKPDYIEEEKKGKKKI